MRRSFGLSRAPVAASRRRSARRLPDYLVSPVVPWRTKLEKLLDLALFWFSADSPYGGVEWGFAVDVGDLGRILAMAGLGGAYFVLWWRQRALRPPSRWHATLAGRGGVAGALVGALGLSTGPCRSPSLSASSAWAGLSALTRNPDRLARKGAP